MREQAPVLSVTQVNEYVKYLMESSPVLKSITVRGEISNFTNHYKSGHFYLTLKDENSILRAVMFRSSAVKLKFMPENGMRVMVTGRLSAFVRDGQYQMYCDTMVPDGAGALAIAYEQLKRKLESEGLFDQSRKKALPKMPMTVGIITSPTGAAVRDMIQVTGRRFPAARILLYPVLVQGEEAPLQMMEAMEYFMRTRCADVIIIGRGGGSIEDLWAFNNEALVRCVANSTIPVISAVGHETDFTLCDFAADRRAPTPSAAAELAVPDKSELLSRLESMQGAMTSQLLARLAYAKSRLESLSSRRVMTSPMHFTDDRRMALLTSERALLTGMERIWEKKKASFVQSTAKLQALDPMAVITRGYAAVFSEDKGVVRSVTELPRDTKFSLRLQDGEVQALSLHVTKEST